MTQTASTQIENSLAKHPTCPLTETQLQQFAEELDALRQEVLDDLGQKDVDYIRRMIRLSRGSEALGRVLLHFSLDPFTWSLGVGALSFGKITENMEIGHNVMHGQYDWTGIPELNSQQYEWDIVCDGDSWRRTHNYEHHTFTNVIGKDRDFGYALLRLSDDTPWRPANLFQFLYFLGLMSMFQWGVALHELETEKLRSREIRLRDKIPFLKQFFKKTSRQLFKDYVFFPLLAGPMAPKVFLGNLFANGIRNVWSGTIIFCGHFTADVKTFSEAEYENESRGHWYYRQLTGSSDFQGSRLFYMMSGHLSHQIEHHMFPDIPGHRYRELQPRVEAICEKYGLPFNNGPFSEQYFSVIRRILKYSLPPMALPNNESAPATA